MSKVFILAVVPALAVTVFAVVLVVVMLELKFAVVISNLAIVVMSEIIGGEL